MPGEKFLTPDPVFRSALLRHDGPHRADHRQVGGESLPGPRATRRHGRDGLRRRVPPRPVEVVNDVELFYSSLMKGTNKLECLSLESPSGPV